MYVKNTLEAMAGSFWMDRIMLYNHIIIIENGCRIPPSHAQNIIQYKNSKNHKRNWLLSKILYFE